MSSAPDFERDALTPWPSVGPDSRITVTAVTPFGYGSKQIHPISPSSDDNVQLFLEYLQSWGIPEAGR